MTLRSDDGDIIEGDYRGIHYKFTKQSYDEFKEEFGVDPIDEIRRGIDLAFLGYKVVPEVDLTKREVALIVYKVKPDASAVPGSDSVN